MILLVNLVADQDFAHVVVGEPLDLVHPLADVLEGLSIGDIVHYDYAVGSSVVAGRQRPEPLLPRRVPYLEFYVLSVKLNGFDLEVDPYRVEKVLVE